MAHSFSSDSSQSFPLTRERLYFDLYTAYIDARRHKRFRQYQLKFEANLHQNLQELADELYERRYKPRPSTCFLIEDPKKREVFAADFRDRIVHHLYFNYTHEMFERTFIADSYSCIKGRGTHYGIHRLEHHIRQASLNYKERAYVLQMDIRGYFMHINRQKLLDICLRTINRNSSFVIDNLSFISYLTHEIVLLDPIIGCHIKGHRDDWRTLPHDKSLFNSPEGCGLPIGNLTSQLFSNIYMNVFDQYMKRQLKCHHYGRYVDDFYVVSSDRQWLKSLIPQVTRFLRDNLGLHVHEGKTKICEVHSGLEFLGAYLKPWRMYVRNSTLKRMHRKVIALDRYANEHRADDNLPIKLRDTLSSFGGVLGHYRSYAIRRSMFGRMNSTSVCGKFDDDWRKFTLLQTQIFISYCFRQF